MTDQKSMATRGQEELIEGRVLVVDDDDMVRLLTCQALSQANLEVDQVNGGRLCLQRLQSHAFDLVLLDLEMPEMDGFETCAKIRQLPAGEDLAVIVITGLDDHDSIQRAYQAGATDFITKPINWPILVQRVRYILRAQKNVLALRESEATLSEAQRLARLGNWDWEFANNSLRWSDEALRILGLPPTANPSFEDFLNVIHPEDREGVSMAIGEALRRGDGYELEHRIVRPDQSETVVNSKGVVIRNEAGRPLRIRNIVQDIRERKQAEAKIHQLVYYSERTGLPNRNLFMEHAARHLDLAREAGNSVFFILLDLDRFQRINDSLSHSVGDQILKQVAHRINEIACQSAILNQVYSHEGAPFFLAHLGGDEFIMSVRGSDRADEVANFAQRLLAKLALPFRIDGQEIYLTASAGIAAFPDDGETLEDLLKDADVALSVAKKAGRNGFRFYATDMNHRALERLSLESQLNRALDNNELEVHYQPQIELVSGKLAGMEALVRWRHPDGSLVSPAEFIPIAEETGLIVPIGEWVLNRACQQSVAWREQGYIQVPMAVNLSARQFNNEDLLDSVHAALRSSGLEGPMLELELTETTIMQDAELARVTLQALKNLGVKLAVDDFGQGYSSMSYLKYFPLDTLKIDRNFIRDLDVDAHNEAIVKAVIALSHGLGLRTVCEGVETEQQRRQLQAMGADVMQGFLISRPVPASQAVKFLSLRSLQDKPAA